MFHLMILAHKQIGSLQEHDPDPDMTKRLKEMQRGGNVTWISSLPQFSMLDFATKILNYSEQGCCWLFFNILSHTCQSISVYV